MTKVGYELSQGLNDLRKLFEPHVGGNGIEMQDAALRGLVQKLQAMHKLAIVTERELEVHRLGEATRDGRIIVEALATEQLQILSRDDPKVVRPDFRRGK